MAIVGRNAGIAELSPRFFGLKMRGFFGWLGWLFLHLIYLPGFRNRFSAVFSWAYNYFTFDRHARLILHGTEAHDWPSLPEPATRVPDAATASPDADDAAAAPPPPSVAGVAREPASGPA
jgi:hypothetical protein